MNPSLQNTNLSIGRQFFENGKYASAKTHLAKCLSDGTGRAEACVILGQIFQREGAFDKSVKCLRKAIAEGQNSVEVQCLLGESLFEARQYDEARETLEVLETNYPEYSKTYIVLGKLFIENNLLAEAITVLQKAVKIHAGISSLFYLLGEAMERSGKYKEAVPVLLQAIDLEPNTIPQSHFLLGKIYLALGNATKAIESFKKSVRIYPLAEVYFPLAKAYQIIQNYQIALKIYEKALERPINRPIQHLILFHQAEILFELGGEEDRLGRKHDLYPKTAKKLAEAIALVPDFTAAKHHLALVHVKMGSFGEAIAEFNTLQNETVTDHTKPTEGNADALEVLTHSYLQQIHLGYALSLNGQYKESQEVFKTVLNDPVVQKERIPRSRVLRRLALVLLEDGKIDESIKIWHQLASIDADNLYGAALALQKLGVKMNKPGIDE